MNGIKHLTNLLTVESSSKEFLAPLSLKLKEKNAVYFVIAQVKRNV